MTPAELLAAGFHEFNWNNGAIMEYWKSITEDEDGFDFRVGVRFGEWKDKPFLVWFITGSSMTSMPKIKTVEQLNQFYEMVTRE